MEEILINACLEGKLVLYDAKRAPLKNKLIKQWSNEGRFIKVCPEALGGMSIPRPPAQMVMGMMC